MRIITYHGISIGTGLNFSFRKTDPFIKGFIKANKNYKYAGGCYSMFIELYNRYSQDPDRVKVVTNTYTK